MSDRIEAPPNNRRRFVYNVFASLVAWFLPIALTFFSTPLIVRGLGYEQYGLYALVFSFISYSFTFGIGRAATKYVAEYRSSGQSEKIREVVSVSFWFSAALSLLGTVFVVIFSERIIADVLQIRPIFHDTVVVSLYAACLTIGFAMIGQVFQGVLQGIHRFDRVSLLITLSGGCLSFGSIALVWSGYGFLALIFWNLFLTIALALASFYLAKKYLPEIAIVFRIKKEAARAVLGFGSGVIGYQIFANVLLIFERSWITRNLGSENLTFYVVPMTLAIYMHSFISSIVLVVFPVISELQNERERLISLYRRATKTIFALVSFITLTIVCSGKTFLTLWMGADFAEKAAPVLYPLILSFSVISFLCVIWQLAEGAGRPRFNAVISLVWLIVSVPLMVWLLPTNGNLGAAVGRLVGHFVTLPFIFIGEKKFLGAVQTDLWKNIIFKIGTAALLAGTAETLVFRQFAPNWAILIGGALLGFIIYAAALLILMFFSSEELGLLSGILAKVKIGKIGSK